MKKTGAAVGGVLFVLLVLAPVALASNVLPNPSFEGSISGWRGWNSTLSQASDGVSGSGALEVVASSTSFSAYTSPRPVTSQPAGVTYTGTGWVRSATPGNAVCIYIREWDSSSQLGSARQCVTSTSSWQKFPPVSYTTKGGTSLEEYAYSTGSKGDSFEIDAMVLDDGAGSTADTTPPDTTITSGPADGSSTTSASATFAFTATETATFECTLDGSAWSQCPSPETYDGLAVGSHTFEVRATDTAGNVDATPAARTWSVTAAADTTPPDTTITSGPAEGSSTTSTSASFAFTASEPATFECALDGAAWSSCSSPVTYDGLAAGNHAFEVRATDTAGNVDATPASRSWSVTAAADTTPPDTTITSGPDDGSSTTSTSATFSFTATEPATFECALDGAAWSSCASPVTYDGLAAGNHAFEVRATDTAGNTDATPAARAWSVTATGTTDPSILLVGDQHACDSVPGAFSAVAQLIDSLDPNGVDPIASLGDESGPDGTADEFTSCFDPVWQPFKARTHPAIGNHDWGTGNADGYFGYWGAAAGPVNEGWYSYDVGTWHVVVLSSYCGDVGGCGLGSPQVAWLKQDLAAHPAQCTLAYWHHPYFTSSPQPGTSGNTSGFWKTLYQYGADVIVNAHIHLYERFAPQDPYGVADPAKGIREFVVGTGGGALVDYSTRAANSEAIDDTTFGVLQLTLHPGSYSWTFEPAAGFGTFTDSGSGTCH